MKDAIRGIYAQVGAPGWAAPNLDALRDVLTDLSWLPPGPVDIEVEYPGFRLVRVLRQIQDETAGSARPVRVHGAH